MSDMLDLHLEHALGEPDDWEQEEVAERIRDVHLEHVDRELAKRKRLGPLEGDERTLYANGVLMGARLVIEALLVEIPYRREGLELWPDSGKEQRRRFQHLRDALGQRRKVAALRRFVTPAVLKAITKPEPLNRMDAPS